MVVRPDRESGLATALRGEYPSTTECGRFVRVSKHYEEVQRALRQAGVEPGELSAFLSEATSGDYDNLLLAAMRWVDVR